MGKLFKYLDKGMEIFVVFIFALMVLIGGMQVFNRFILNQSLSWSEEFQKFAHIWVVFLTIPIAYSKNSHIGMEIFVAKLPKGARRFLGFLMDAVWLVFSVSLTVYTWKIMQVTKTQTSPGLDIRMDHVYLSLFIGGVYLIVMSLRKLAVRFAPGLGKGV